MSTLADTAKPVIELLDKSPVHLTKLLQLVEGRSYAVVSLWAKRTSTQGLDDRTGKTVVYESPKEEEVRCTFVIRDDGTIYGEGHDMASIEELGFQLSIKTMPKEAKLWTTKGVKAYRNGHRPNPKHVFKRLVTLVDRFMSFDCSLADQKTMCELVALYILATWFHDAFDVIGYLWPNGIHGAGKTKLGNLICAVAYLGEVLLSGSTFASLRDMSDLGATLLFDDAESFNSANRIDGEKRSLLLAGNRRGATVTVKEQGPDKNWRTRHVNAYCPRLFTAINWPDPVLASRTIVIPLVRTVDKQKANSEVLDHSQWPCDQRELLDDLWSLSLANLPAMPDQDKAVAADAPLIGRALEPWRAMLAVAHWLDGLGEDGLYERMCNLAKSYQTERADLETVDQTKLVVRALIELLAPGAPLAPLAPLYVETSQVSDRVNKLILEEELATFASVNTVGKTLRMLRLEKAPKSSGQKRRWKTTPAQLDSIARTNGFKPILPDAPVKAIDDTLSCETGQMGQTGHLRSVPEVVEV